MDNAVIIEAVTPQSIGPYSSTFNTQLAATYALEARLTSKSRFGHSALSNEISLLAANATGKMTASFNTGNQGFLARFTHM